jgi:probable rRNA maturation factor
LIIYIDSDYSGGAYKGIRFDEVFFLSVVCAARGRVNIGEDAEISLVLASDATIRELNRGFRGIDKATDVLSFPQGDNILLGDIVISLETAERKAAEAETDTEEEVAFLFIHGLLHLLGYDHTEEETESEMYALQETILENWLSGR